MAGSEIPTLISFSPNTTILSADTNSNNTSIRSTFNGNFNGTTGHKHTGVNGDGTKLDSTGLDLTANYNWTGTHKIGPSLSGVSSVAGVSTYFFTGSATASNTGALAIFGSYNSDNAVAQVDFYNAVSASVDKRLGSIKVNRNGADNTGTMAFLVSNSGTIGTVLSFTNSQAQFGSVDASLVSGKKLYFDSFGDSYIYEQSANDIRFAAGGNENLRITTSTVTIGSSADLYLNTTKKLYFNASDQKTSIYENSANDVRIQANSTDGFRVTSSLVEAMSGRDFAIPAAKKVYYDGGGDTYDTESSANTLDKYVGGVNVMTWTSSAITSNVSTTLASGANLTLTSGDLAVSNGAATIGRSANTGTTLAVLTISGANSGGGTMTGLNFAQTAGTLTTLFSIAAGYVDTTALGAYSGRLSIQVGANTRYIPYYV